MPNSSLQHLLATFQGPPTGPIPDSQSWEELESTIHRAIPLDFKAIIEHTGGCSLGRCFLRNPAEKNNIHVALSHGALIREYIQWGEVAEKELNIKLYPEEFGWIQLAKKDQVFFMLRAHGDDITIVDFSSWEVIETARNFSDLLWFLFEDRRALDCLGQSIWHESRQFFGIH